MTIARRKFLTGSAIGLAALAMPAVRTSAATRKITLGGYFDMADAIKKYWSEPFQQKCGAQVFYDPGNSINQISKMLEERGNPAHSMRLRDERCVPRATTRDLTVPIAKPLLPQCGKRRLHDGAGRTHAYRRHHLEECFPVH